MKSMQNACPTSPCRYCGPSAALSFMPQSWAGGDGSNHSSIEVGRYEGWPGCMSFVFWVSWDLGKGGSLLTMGLKSMDHMGFACVCIHTYIQCVCVYIYTYMYTHGYSTLYTNRNVNTYVCIRTYIYI